MNIIRMFTQTFFITVLIIFIVAEEAITMEQEAREKIYRNEKFGYTVSYPDHWFPSGIIEANAFVINNSDPNNPQSIPKRNRAYIIIADRVNESVEATAKFLDSLLVGEKTPEQEHRTLTIDGSRAVRVCGKVAYPTGSSI